MDTALTSARQLVDDDQAYALLGCDWGRRIALPGEDVTPCPQPAEARVVLHIDGDPAVFQFCDRHRGLIDAASEPHAPCGRPGCDGCGGAS
jgi:hypothetical protein